MKLANHNVWSGGRKKRKWRQQFSNRTTSSYNRRFLYAHGDHVFLFVYHKSGYNGQRKGKDTNDIFYHRISHIKGQATILEILLFNFFMIFADNLKSLINRQFVEFRNFMFGGQMILRILESCC